MTNITIVKGQIPSSVFQDSSWLELLCTRNYPHISLFYLHNNSAQVWNGHCDCTYYLFWLQVHYAWDVAAPLGTHRWCSRQALYRCTSPTLHRFMYFLPGRPVRAAVLNKALFFSSYLHLVTTATSMNLKSVLCKCKSLQLAIKKSCTLPKSEHIEHKYQRTHQPVSNVWV